MRNLLLKEGWQKKQEKESWINCDKKKKARITLYEKLYRYRGNIKCHTNQTKPCPFTEVD